MTQEQKQKLAERIAIEACEEIPIHYSTAKKVALNALNARDEEVEQLKAELE